MNPRTSLIAAVILASSLPAQLIVAHRGASHDAPENTMAAFRLAWSQGADAIEGDFHLSADGRIVCIHDKTTKRTTGVDLEVRSTPFRRLRELDVGAWKGSEFDGERIPTLEEVLAAVKPGKRLFLEIKCGPEIVEPLLVVLGKTPRAVDRLVIISFGADVIAACKENLPKIPAYWLSSFDKDKETGRRPGALETLAVLRQSKADGLDCRADASVVSPDFVRTMQNSGMALHTWTVDDPETAALFRKLGFESITTNRPAWLRSRMPTRGLAAGLRWYFPMDGAARAVSPNRPRAKATIGGKAAFAPAVFGDGLHLGQSKAPLVIDDGLPEVGTLLFWYRPAPWYDYQTIIDTPVHQNQWEMWIDGGARLHFRVHQQGARLVHAFHRTAAAEAWHHMAVSWDREDRSSRAVRLFVNGDCVAATSWRGHPWVGAGKRLHLGGGHPKNSFGKGLIDDVALFDRVLEPRDVAFAAQAGIRRLLDQ